MPSLKESFVWAVVLLRRIGSRFFVVRVLTLVGELLR
jgi:hypothetical protein